MKGTWVAAVRGYVVVKVIGNNAQALLNLAVERQIVLWNIAWTPQSELIFGVTVPDFFRLRPLLRQCGLRIRIMQKQGLPFRLARLARRKTFAVGMAAFIALLYILSTFVWQVKIEGETAISHQQILQVAREEGIYPLRWAPKLQGPEQLAGKLVARLPDAAWVGVEKRGTTIVISVVDATKPDDGIAEGPSDLVAKYDAVITHISAESGRPLVARHDRVKKGQVLVSGWIGDEISGKAVASKGTIKGLVWHEVQIASPLTRKQHAYTGAANKRSYWVIGNRALQISGYGGESFAQSRTSATLQPWYLFSWKLPFAIMKEKEMEVITIQTELTEAQAKEAGLAEARKQMRVSAGPDARITAENILHEQIEHGKVVLTVFYEVEQSIAMSQPVSYSSANEEE